MSDYMTLYVRKGETLTEGEERLAKTFMKRWEWMSWRNLSAYFYLDTTCVVVKDLIGVILNSYMSMDLQRRIRSFVDDEKVEVYEISIAIKMSDFANDLVDIIGGFSSKICLGSEYCKHDECERFDWS